MTTTDLRLTDKGSLPKPGPLGRLLRLGLGYWVLMGFVYEIEPGLSSSSKKAKIKILIADNGEKLILGSLVEIKLPLKSLSGTILAPLKSVEIGEAMSRVRIVEQGKLAWREVKVGNNQGEYIEILAGLSDGDLLVISGGEFLEEGVEVEWE